MEEVRTQALIREATPDDARAIATVHVASWRSTYRGLLDDLYLDNLSVDDHEARWQRLLAGGNGDTFVAEEGGEVVGFASCGRERDQDPIYLGELYAIYLLESHQRRGIGRLLVSVVAERLIELEYRSMLVWVLAANPSRAFYESLGGTFIRSRQMEIAGENKEEAGYGWLDAGVLI
jgi:ribosomal protein S18 acetylase RimI-like enzyme